VITGFRIGPATASVLTGVTPDLWCFGKVIGGGLPIGAFGGARELMGALAPSGPVYQAGTLSGNPLATAAGLAVLNEVTPADYGTLGARVARFAAALADAVRAGGLSAVAPVAGTLAGLFVGPPPGAGLTAPSDFEGAHALAATGTYPPFFHALLRRGVMIAPGAYEVLFCGLSHRDAEIDRAVEAAGEAAEEVAKTLG